MKIKIKDQYGQYEFWVLVTMFILCILAALIAIFGIGFVVEKYECKQYGNTTSRNVLHVIPSGCYVQSNTGQFIPRKEFDKRAITNEASQP